MTGSEQDDEEARYPALFRHQLIESLQLLAAEYADQVTTLPSYVCIPDEMALTLDDCLLPLVRRKVDR